MNTPDWTEYNPFLSTQIVIKDTSWRLFFHKNKSVIEWQEKITLIGWKLENADKTAYHWIIREVKEETWIVLLSDNLQKVCEDGPNEYEKWWFFAQIYFTLISSWVGDTLSKNNAIEVFNSLDLFESSGKKEWLDFDRVSKLVYKVLSLWK